MNMDYDKDGFIKLIRKSATGEKPEKKSKKPFKKGSWKAWLFKKLKKWKSSKHVQDFHFVKQENLIIVGKDGKLKTTLTGHKPDDKLIEKLEKNKKNSFILINCGENIFTKISVKTYLKLMEIDRIAISVTLRCSDDAGEEEFDAYDDEQVFDNINSFLSWVNYYRQLVYGVCEIQSHMCGFMYTRYKAKTLIRKVDGTFETYKGDFNEVLKAYDITPLL